MGASECDPPLIIFIIGTGRVNAELPPIYSYSGIFLLFAAACEIAKETPKMALAPKIHLFSVPSISIIRLSNSS